MIHFTPSQVRLLINGYIVDEAHGLDYEITDDKTPLYGFRDRNFADVSIGRTLVYGSLYINFIHKGYLLQAIAQMTVSREDEFDPSGAVRIRDERNNEYRTANLDPRELNDADAVEYFLGSAARRLDIDEFNKRMEAVKGTWGWKENKNSPSILPEDSLRSKEAQGDLFDNITASAPREGPKGFSNDALLARPGVLTVPFDMIIAYGPNMDNPMRRETIKGVYFRGQSKVIRASVAGAEDVLLERYQFLAKTIV